MRLADLQARLASALVTGVTHPCADLLTGSERPLQRFGVHARHVHASLTRAIVERFPATAWLAGSALVTDAAAAFARGHPPTCPCMAEYGERFPAFLGTWPGAAPLPSLAQFATIDWHLGRLAIATDDPPVVLRLDWSLDELMTFFLSDRAPDAYALRAETVRLELRGARGELSLERRAEEV